jgi:hypothetical protein
MSNMDVRIMSYFWKNHLGNFSTCAYGGFSVRRICGFWVENLFRRVRVQKREDFIYGLLEILCRA